MYTCDHCKGELDPLNNGLSIALFNDNGRFHMQWTIRSIEVNSQLCRDCFIKAVRTGLDAYDKGIDLTPSWVPDMLDLGE
jgi:hypothetical protein